MFNTYPPIMAFMNDIMLTSTNSIFTFCQAFRSTIVMSTINVRKGLIHDVVNGLLQGIVQTMTRKRQNGHFSSIFSVFYRVTILPAIKIIMFVKDVKPCFSLNSIRVRTLKRLVLSHVTTVTTRNCRVFEFINGSVSCATSNVQAVGKEDNSIRRLSTLSTNRVCLIRISIANSISHSLTSIRRCRCIFIKRSIRRRVKPRHIQARKRQKCRRNRNLLRINSANALCLINDSGQCKEQNVLRSLVYAYAHCCRQIRLIDFLNRVITIAFFYLYVNANNSSSSRGRDYRGSFLCRVLFCFVWHYGYACRCQEIGCLVIIVLQ